MATAEHLALLQRGVKSWNSWREENPKIQPDLSGASLFCTNLTFANLSQTNLTEADLYRADLFGADLNQANLTSANLVGANLGNADLNSANLFQANLSEASLFDADLTRSNLVAAILDDADLTRAILIQANLTGSSLKNVNLTAAHALNSNLSAVEMTGATIEDWNINSKTHLEGITCQYVYLRNRSRERRPSSGDFAVGEFTQLFRKAMETIDLIFLNGVEWSALLTSIQSITIENAGYEVAIQAIEHKDNNTFVVRVQVPEKADKSVIERHLKQKYQQAVQVLSQKYQNRLTSKDQQIQAYRQQYADLTQVFKVLANQQIHLQTIAISGSQVMSDTSSKYDLRGATIGNFADTVQSGGRQQTIQQGHPAEDNQETTTTISEVLQIFNQLSQIYASASEQTKYSLAMTAIQQKAETNPTFKQRLLSAADAGSTEVIKAFQSNPFVSIPLATVKGWLKAK